MQEQSSPIPAPLVKARPQAKSLSDALLRFLGGYRLTLSLFMLLGFFAALGSFIPQGDDSGKIADLYGAKALYWAQVLGADEIYRSAWFILVLALMALNLILVTWLRVPHVWKIAKAADATLLKDPLVPKTAFQAVWITEKSPLEALEAARYALQGEFPVLASQEGPSKRVLIGERHRLSLWAAHIVHVGLLLLLFAGAVKVLAGSNRYFSIKEGESSEVQREIVRFGFWMEPLQLPGFDFALKLPRLYEHLKVKEDFKLALDKFDVQYYEKSAAPKLFRSDVRILRGDKTERAASIQVNDPLEVDGTLIYQSSYGYDGLYSAHFELDLPGLKDRLDVIAPYQKRTPLLNTGWELEVTDFYPDATMAGPGKLVNLSGDLNNPAIRVKFYQHGRERAHTWFVYSVPDIQMTHIEGLKLVGKTVDPIPYTVLQANHDAGVPYAAAGAALVVFGTFAAFYLFYHKAWVLVEPLPNGGSRVQMAGFVRRNKIVFQRVFDRLQERLSEKLGEPEAGEASPASAPPGRV